MTMTIMNPAGAQLPSTPELPSGWPVGSYETYAKAQEAVEYLREHDFAIEHLTILGSDLKLVERVTGPLSRGRSVRTAAMVGLYWGVFVGLLLMLVSPDGAGLALVATSVALGAGFGAGFGLIGYRVLSKRRGYGSQTQYVATHYELLCTPSHADQARDLLARLALRGGEL